MISKYNVEAKVGINLILINQDDQVVMTNFSEEEMNLHRREFNRIAAKNARENGTGIYTTVYFFKADASEYLMMLPIYDQETYRGTVQRTLKIQIGIIACHRGSMIRLLPMKGVILSIAPTTV